MSCGKDNNDESIVESRSSLEDNSLERTDITNDTYKKIIESIPLSWSEEYINSIYDLYGMPDWNYAAVQIKGLPEAQFPYLVSFPIIKEGEVNAILFAQYKMDENIYDLDILSDDIFQLTFEEMAEEFHVINAKVIMTAFVHHEMFYFNRVSDHQEYLVEFCNTSTLPREICFTIDCGWTNYGGSSIEDHDYVYGCVYDIFHCSGGQGSPPPNLNDFVDNSNNPIPPGGGTSDDPSEGNPNSNTFVPKELCKEQISDILVKYVNDLEVPSYCTSGNESIKQQIMDDMCEDNPRITQMDVDLAVSAYIDEQTDLMLNALLSGNLDFFEGCVNPIDDLNECEFLMISQHPFCAQGMIANYITANLLTHNYIGSNGANDCSDAFRHTLFNALNANTCGEEVAQLFGIAHECVSDSKTATTMDFHNNNIGYQIYRDNPNIGIQMNSYGNSDIQHQGIHQLIDMICDELSNGEMLVYKDGPLINDNPEENLISSSDCECI